MDILEDEVDAVFLEFSYSDKRFHGAWSDEQERDLII